MEVTQEMLNAAMKKGVEVGLFPKYADTDTYMKNWEGMKEVLEAALQAAKEEA